MAKKSKTKIIVDGIAGEHLALSVAAHLARTQLIPEPFNLYDAEHLTDMLNSVATALARTVPLHITDVQTGDVRQVTPGELDGARMKRGGTVVTLKDGRALAGVTIRRADLRQGIAILKAVGVEGVVTLAPPQVKPAEDNATDTGVERFRELEKLLTPPLASSQVERAKKVALYIARHSRHGRVANLAMQLISALQGTHATDDIPGGFRMALARLGAALNATADVNK
jgi:hypothetical protein